MSVLKEVEDRGRPRARATRPTALPLVGKIIDVGRACGSNFPELEITYLATAVKLTNQILQKMHCAFI